MTRSDILVMGELNVDLILSDIPSFPKIGTEIIANKMVLALGSSSGIFASNAAAMGATVSFLGKIGTDYFGQFIVDSLNANQVRTESIIRSQDFVSGATVAMVFGEDRAMVTHPGAMGFLSGEDLTARLLREFRHFHVSSVFLQPLVKRDIVKIFKLAKSCGLSTSLDSQWDPLEKWELDFPEVLKYVDVFLPNDSEIKGIARADSVDAAVEKIAPLVKTLVVKMGTQGSMAVCEGRRVFAPAFLNHETVDAIGAGDSFDAGFITKFIAGAPVESCLRHGNLMGAINTTAPGGTSAFSSPEHIRRVASQKFHVDISSEAF